VSLSSSSPAVQPPATVTVPAGVESVSFTATTRQVSANTPATITATWRGASVQGTTTLTPQPPPTSLTLDPTLTTGSNGSNGRVTAADPRNGDVTFSLSSSRPDVAQVPTSVMVPQFAAAGGFIISTTPPSTRTVVTISVSGGGVTLTATLTVDPFPSTPPPAALATLSLSPSTLTGGASSTGVVTSTQTAPTGGLVVTLSSSDTTVATVPASVTIAAGASSASFTVSTSAGTTTRTATITGSAGGATQSAVLTVNASATSPPPATDTVSISRAEWKSGALRVDATSSNTSATLKVYVTSTGALLGTISGGRLQTTTSTNPGNVT